MGRLHCLLPWWEDAAVDFMTSGGYNVASQIKMVFPGSITSLWMLYKLFNMIKYFKNPPISGTTVHSFLFFLTRFGFQIYLSGKAENTHNLGGERPHYQQ